MIQSKELKRKGFKLRGKPCSVGKTIWHLCHETLTSEPYTVIRLEAAPRLEPTEQEDRIEEEKKRKFEVILAAKSNDDVVVVAQSKTKVISFPTYSLHHFYVEELFVDWVVHEYRTGQIGIHRAEGETLLETLEPPLTQAPGTNTKKIKHSMITILYLSTGKLYKSKGKII